jgi:DNA-directed RNA polymerase subunit F
VEKMNVLNEEFITDAEAKDVLKQKEKQAELKFEQKNAMDILAKSSDFEAEKIKKLVGELRGIERLRDKQIISIANFLPEDREEMRVVLHKEYTNFIPEEIDRILEVVKKNI